MLKSPIWNLRPTHTLFISILRGAAWCMCGTCHAPEEAGITIPTRGSQQALASGGGPFDAVMARMGFTYAAAWAVICLVVAGAIAPTISVPLCSEGSPSMEELHREARDDALAILAANPDSCSNWRKNSENQGCTAADQCGKGWLFSSQELLLVVPCLGSSGTTAAAEDGATGAWLSGESRTVTIVGLKAEGGGEESDCDSHDMSILVRLQGPEALAEAAMPVEGRCAWTVEFLPSMEGDYTFDATVIDWRGGIDPHRDMCNEVAGQYPEGSVEMGSAGTHVVFYGLSEACCTLCTRLEGCVGWSSTDDYNTATVNGERCVFYSSVSGPPVEDESLDGIIRSGGPRDEEAPKYLGPSMSIPRSWCAPENAVLVGSGAQLSVGAGASSSAGENESEGDDLPICSPSDTVPPPGGRWVGLGDVQCGVQERAQGDPYWPKYNQDVFGVTKPEECFLQPDMVTTISPHDAYGRAIAGGYVWKPDGCRYSLMNADERQKCFSAKNITRFLDYGDSMIQTSRQPRVELWIPNAEVDDRAATTAAEANDRKIKSGCHGGAYFDTGSGGDDATDAGSTEPRLSLEPRGHSSYCGAAGFHYSKSDHIRDLISSFEPDVVLANWGMVHRLWHHSFDSEIGDFFADLGEALDQMTENGEFRPRFMFWLSTPFLVSEREPHCLLERGIQFNEGLRSVLQPRGWIEVDWIAMTRKFSVDIVDGMHHGKHATRNLAYLLTHRMCHDTDESGV